LPVGINVLAQGVMTEDRHWA